MNTPNLSDCPVPLIAPVTWVNAPTSQPAITIPSDALQAALTAARARIAELEKERDIELKRATHYRDEWQKQCAELASMCLHYAELERDRARLDWLERASGIHWQSHFTGLINREAIDRVLVEAENEARADEEGEP